ncbi:hypothetical protein WCT94_17255 [Pectobacterium sp. 1950-15]|uniref:hypothetical protein n=1 Tax=Pectobacterium sp. 1950-15 TaxID=3128982 RepID=UPI0030180CDB
MRSYLGFLDQGKGNYFLPVTIEPHLLTECWQDYGEFPVEHEVFSPLRAALETLLHSTEVMDAIFSSERKTSTDELVG